MKKGKYTLLFAASILLTVFACEKPTPFAKTDGVVINSPERDGDIFTDTIQFSFEASSNVGLYYLRCYLLHDADDDTVYFTDATDVGSKTFKWDTFWLPAGFTTTPKSFTLCVEAIDQADRVFVQTRTFIVDKKLINIPPPDTTAQDTTP
jgi:hypothetical protein